MGRQRSLHVNAFAKINLDLRVVGTLPGGYHELRTTFQSIALGDVLIFTPLRDGRIAISCDDPACPADDTNLVWKAADLVRRAASKRLRGEGVSVSIVKRIPMQAGLGGGSSDAAAALRACASLWGVKAVKLPALAASIGADVPYFFCGGTALGVGRGDRIRPLPDRAASWVVLVLPDFGVSTKDAYGWFDDVAVASSRASGSSLTFANDLEHPVAVRHPRIGAIVGSLRQAGAFQAAMSGSGSAVFGLFKTRKGAEAAARRLSGRRQRAIVTRTLARANYRAFSRPSDLPPPDSVV